MQRRWVRRLSPKVLVVALSSVAMVVTAVAVSQADPWSGRAVSVAMLSGGDAASLPGADMALPGPATADAEAASLTPESPPPTEPSTTTTAAGGAVVAANTQAHARARAQALSHDRGTRPPLRSALPAPGPRQRPREVPPALSSARLGHHRHGVPAAVRPTGRSPRRGDTDRLQRHGRRTHPARLPPADVPAVRPPHRNQPALPPALRPVRHRRERRHLPAAVPGSRHRRRQAGALPAAVPGLRHWRLPAGLCLPAAALRLSDRTGRRTRRRPAADDDLLPAALLLHPQRGRELLPSAPASLLLHPVRPGGDHHHLPRSAEPDLPPAVPGAEGLPAALPVRRTD